MKVLIRKLHVGMRKYYAIAKINFANRLAYPGNLVGEVVFLLFIFSTLFFVHRLTMAHAVAAQREGLSIAQVMWMIFFTNIVGLERARGIMRDINEEILSGQIAYQLNRPFSYLLFHLARYVGDKLVSIIFSGVITGLFLYVLVGIPDVSFVSLSVGISMFCMGIMINFLMQCCIGLCTFWIDRIDPLRWIYMQALIVMGGAAVPVAFYPQAIKKIILLLPFSNIVYGAARIMVDSKHPDMLFYCGLQVIWLIIMLIVTRIIFKIGVRNVAVGGG